MNLSIEFMSEDDRESVIDIFNYYIENSIAAYRDEKVEYTFFEQLIGDCINESKYVLKIEGEIIGFALLEYFSSLRVFSKVAEVSYFIREEYSGIGIGKKALEILERDARKMGIRTLVANIASDNLPSIRFHKKNDFIKYGELENAGTKFDRDFGLVYMRKNI